MFQRHSLSLTEGPLFSSIVRFSLPLMLSNVLQVLFNMSDIAVVGRFAGAEAIAAVGSTGSIINLIVNLFIGIIVSVYLLFSKEHFSGGAKKITYGIFKEDTANQIISDCRFIHKTFIGFLVGKIIDSIII